MPRGPGQHRPHALPLPLQGPPPALEAPPVPGKLSLPRLGGRGAGHHIPSENLAPHSSIRWPGFPVGESSAGQDPSHWVSPGLGPGDGQGGCGIVPFCAGRGGKLEDCCVLEALRTEDRGSGGSHLSALLLGRVGSGGGGVAPG